MLKVTRHMPYCLGLGSSSLSFESWHQSGLCEFADAPGPLFLCVKGSGAPLTALPPHSCASHRGLSGIQENLLFCGKYGRPRARAPFTVGIGVMPLLPPRSPHTLLFSQRIYGFHWAAMPSETLTCTHGVTLRELTRLSCPFLYR